MKKYSTHFEVVQGRVTKRGTIIPANYDFWEPLISYFIKKCTHFRIDCWNDEEVAINSAKVFGETLETDITNMKVFVGEITEEFIFELMYNPFDEEGKIKWFSIFLMDRDKFVFSSEHYGSEFAAEGLTEDEIEYIRSIIPEDFHFHVFEMS